MSKLGGKCLCSMCDLQGTGTCVVEAAKTGHCGTQPTSDNNARGEICPQCNGAGTVVFSATYPVENCPRCRGTGELSPVA